MWEAGLERKIANARWMKLGVPSIQELKAFLCVEERCLVWLEKLLRERQVPGFGGLLKPNQKV